MDVKLLPAVMVQFIFVIKQHIFLVS